jgi:hypothetical protein
VTTDHEQRTMDQLAEQLYAELTRRGRTEEQAELKTTAMPDPDTLDEPRTFACLDCGINEDYIREYYMVQNIKWYEERGPSPRRGMLCTGCLERRLVRKRPRKRLLRARLRRRRPPTSGRRAHHPVKG